MKIHTIKQNKKTLSIYLVVGFIVIISLLTTRNAMTRSVNDDTQLQTSGDGHTADGNPVYLPIVITMDSTQMRPYTDTSYWNTPITANPQYDSYSEQMITTIGLDSDGRILSDPSQYTFPVYFVDETTPRWDVPCSVYNCMIVTPGGSSTVPLLQNVPIPPAAQPSNGSDGQMIIIDQTTYTEYDFWQVERTAAGWTVSNATVYNILWDGTPAKYNSRGAGVPYYAGLIRPWEIEQGHIDHALAFGYPETAKDHCVFPATKTDGDSTLPYAIPEGAHLQLDPTLTEADFDQMGLDRTGKIIARTLQKYGMILIDTSGQAKIYVEDLVNNPYATAQWSDPELNLTNKTISTIPYTAFRVLLLPSVYWNTSVDGTTLNGDCYTYP